MATTLSPGDITLVSYGSDDPDSFAFVFLRNVEAGTTVSFTDNGWLAAGGFRSGEGTSTYIAPTDIAAGTIIPMPLGTIEFNVDGDQIIAYQGTEASPTLLYAIDFADNNTAFASEAFSETTSALPAGLTLGVTALALPLDNAAYAGPSFGTQLDLLEAIGDPTRWTGDDVIPQPRGTDLNLFDRPTVDLDFNNTTHFGRDYETSVTLGGPGVQIADADIRVREGSGSFVTSATIRVIGPEFGDLLTVNGSLPFGILASSYNPFTGVLALSGLATPDAYETAIRQVEFSTTDGPIGATKRVQATIFDGADSSSEATAFIHVSLAGAAATAPVLDLDANNSNGGGADYTATYTTGGPGTSIADVDISITDADSATIASAKITILNWNQPAGDTLSISGLLPAGITASAYNPVNLTLTLSGIASLAAYQTALRQVVFSSTNPSPGTGDRGIQVTANDGTLNSNVATTYMHVVAGPVNTPPALNLDSDFSTTGGANYLTTYTDGGPGVAIADTDVTINDSDSQAMASATITLTNPHTGDILTFNGPLPLGIGVSGSGSSVITLTGAASAAAYQIALQQIAFSNTGSNPTSDTRIINVVVNDGAANSNLAQAIVEVTEVNNSAPVIDLDGDNSTAPGTTFRTTFTENGVPVPIADTDTLITDADSGNLASATITLTNAEPGDLLSISGTLPTGIVASAYDPTTGVLTLTTISGPRTLADYEAALEQIRFSAAGDNPVQGTRVIEVVVNDGVNDGDTATALITVTAVNDAPAITVDASATYVENDASVALSPSALVNDADNPDLTFAVVQITGGSFAGDGDELSIAGAIDGTLGNITFHWSPALHALVMAGAEATGFYQSLLQNVEFRSINDNPTDYNASPTRALSWTISDGTTQTTTTSVVNIADRNDAPVVVVAATATYIENGPPLIISGAATASDADNLQLTAGQVTIVSGVLAADVLTVNGLQSGTFNGINFSYDASLHSLLFSLAAPVGDYQAFLRTVQFQSVGDDPTHGGANPTRTLSWTLFDGSDVSTAAATILSITAVNDPPTAQDGSASGTEDTPISGTLIAADVDSASLNYRLGTPAAHGAVVINPDGTFTYTPTQDFFGTDNFTFLANDGDVDSNAATISLSITAVNDPPTAQDGSASGTEDTPVTGTLIATDIDSESLTYQLGTQAAHGTVVVNPNGVFTYTPAQDFFGTDSFTFVANDGVADSNAATVRLNVATVNDPPAITSNGGGATADINVVENSTAVTTVTVTDPDGPSLAFSIVGGSDAGKFQIDASNGALSFVDAPNFEVPGDFDANNSYIVQIRASDGSLSDDQTITVNVTDVPAEFADGNDFNADGFADIFWEIDSGELALWEMNGLEIALADYFHSGATATGRPGADWHVVDTGDTNGDGRTDILWRTDTGMLAVWLMDGNHIIGADYLKIGTAVTNAPGSDWHALGLLDANGDGNSDILWQTDSGALAIWQLDGNQITFADYLKSGTTQAGVPGPDWRIVGDGDFDGDGKDGILWRTDSGALATWELDGTQIKSASFLAQGAATVGAPGPDWHVVDVADFDGDSKSDILWRTGGLQERGVPPPGGGQVAIWEMDGNQIKLADYTRLGSSIAAAPGPDWHLLGADDYNHDGKADLLWQTDSGALAIWQMDGTNVASAGFTMLGATTVGAPGSDWHVFEHHYDLV